MQARLSEARLVTLTGAGGSGKTRLALHVAGSLAPRFTAGAWWCDLGPISDPAFVPQAVASALGLADVVRSPLAALTATIGPTPRLLVLDACEHLTVAVAALADALLRGCPGLRVLATSLQPLGVPGEQVWPVPPLPLPPTNLPPARLAEHPAVALFVARAMAAVPDFRLTVENAPLIAAICRRLEGLPLAIELAAAWSAVLGPEQIERRLTEGLAMPERGPAAGATGRARTLTATLARGYNLLTTDEQRLFPCLSVFPGDFTLAMAAAVAGEDEETALAPLAGLAHKSMVVVADLPARGPARYRLLEPVRIYARELLEEAGEGPTARDRHLDWATRLAEAAAGAPLGPISGEAMVRLTAEYDGLRAAMRWAVTTRQVEAGLRLVVALFRFWFNRGPLAEGRGWADELLTLPEADAVPPILRARATFVSGRLACRQGDDRVALARGAESLRLAQEAGDRATEARALDLLGLVNHDLNDFDGAIAHHRAALGLRRELGDDYAVAVSLNNLGLVHFDRGDYDEAAASFAAGLEVAARAGVDLLPALVNLAEIALARGDSEAAGAHTRRLLALAEAAGDQHSLATATGVLTSIARLTGDLTDAARLGERALSLCRRLDGPTWEGDALRELGDLAATQGDLAASQARYNEGLAAYARAGSTRGRGVLLARLALLAARQGNTAGALAQAREAVTLLAPTGHRHPLIEAVEAVAVALAATDPDTAARLLTAASAEREHLRVPRLPPWRDLIQQTVERLAAAVGLPISLEAAARLAVGERPSPAVAVTTQPPTPELCARALGPVQVTVGGQPVPASAWTYRKACELFFYLLDRPAATRTTIGLDLWPDASPAQLRNYLHRSLHFIRRALGDAERIRFAAGAYAVNRKLPLWYDVAALEASLQQAAAMGPADALPPGQRAVAIALLEEAVGLWRGEFLADLDASEWAILRREELRMTYLQALLDLGRLHLLDGQYERAAAIYRRCLAEDPYLELARRELMRCLARQGERGQALRRYRELTDLLAADLKATPSPETTLLYERIRRGDDV